MTEASPAWSSTPVPPSTTRSGRFDRFLPPTPLARKLSVQSVLFAVGEGTFLTGSAVFFTQIVGLSAAQVGLGLTIAGVVSFFFAVPIGRLADRVGPKRMWAIGSFAGAALYATWPLINGLWAYLAMMIVLELVGVAGWSGRGAYTLDVFPREERVQSQAFMRAALNIGFSSRLPCNARGWRAPADRGDPAGQLLHPRSPTRSTTGPEAGARSAGAAVAGEDRASDAPEPATAYERVDVR